MGHSSRPLPCSSQLTRPHQFQTGKHSNSAYYDALPSILSIQQLQLHILSICLQISEAYSCLLSRNSPLSTYNSSLIPHTLQYLNPVYFHIFASALNFLNLCRFPKRRLQFRWVIYINPSILLNIISDFDEQFWISTATYERVVRTGVAVSPGGRRNHALIKLPFLLLILGTVSLGGLNITR